MVSEPALIRAKKRKADKEQTYLNILSLIPDVYKGRGEVVA